MAIMNAERIYSPRQQHPILPLQQKAQKREEGAALWELACWESEVDKQAGCWWKEGKQERRKRGGRERERGTIERRRKPKVFESRRCVCVCVCDWRRRFHGQRAWMYVDEAEERGLGTQMARETKLKQLTKNGQENNARARRFKPRGGGRRRRPRRRNRRCSRRCRCRWRRRRRRR